LPCAKDFSRIAAHHEREQERVGHDIHDSLCQHLTGNGACAEVVAEKSRNRKFAGPQRRGRVVDLIEEGSRLAAQSGARLSAVEISHNGLTCALTELAFSMSELFNVSAASNAPEPVRMDRYLHAAHLYRIAQEAVGNAIKHGEAKNITVSWNMKGRVRVAVVDDGKGLSPTYRNGRGMGLRIMNYRSDLITVPGSRSTGAAEGTELSARGMGEAAQ